MYDLMTILTRVTQGHHLNPVFSFLKLEEICYSCTNTHFVYCKGPHPYKYIPIVLLLVIPIVLLLVNMWTIEYTWPSSSDAQLVYE